MQTNLNNVAKELKVVVMYPEDKAEICPMPDTCIFYQGKQVGRINQTDVDDWQLITIGKDVFDVNVWLDDSVYLGEWKAAVYDHDDSTYAEIKNIEVLNGDI